MARDCEVEALDSKEFVETRTKRYMAQALEEFETKIEEPLWRGDTISESDIESVKRTFRRKLRTLASDCTDLMPPDLQINGFEPVVRR